MPSSPSRAKRRPSRAFSGRYATGHFRGTFLCVCCKAELFSADHKFESGTGWPSFFRPINERALHQRARLQRRSSRAWR